MGLFDIFKKQTKNIVASGDSWSIDCLHVDKSDWSQVFSACLGKMRAIQYACNDIVVKGDDWNIIFSEGVIMFGDRKYPLQFIGSESNYDDSWLWGWKNINGFSEKIICFAQDTKELGEKWGLEPLCTERFFVDDLYNGHNVSLVACALKEGYCYYRGTHSGGTVFVAFNGVPEEVFSPVDVKKFASITLECIEQFDIDHKIFVESFLLWNKTAYDWNENILIAHFKDDLKIEFENKGEKLYICSIKTA